MENGSTCQISQICRGGRDTDRTGHLFNRRRRARAPRPPRDRHLMIPVLCPLLARRVTSSIRPSIRVRPSVSVRPSGQEDQRPGLYLPNDRVRVTVSAQFDGLNGRTSGRTDGRRKSFIQRYFDSFDRGHRQTKEGIGEGGGGMGMMEGRKRRNTGLIGWTDATDEPRANSGRAVLFLP